MTNYYTLLHLCGEFNRKCSGAKFISSYSQHRSVWEAVLHHEQHEHKQHSDSQRSKHQQSHSQSKAGLRIIFSAHPTETAIFTRPERPRRQKNVTSFFEDLEGKQILGFEMAGEDRLMICHFEGGDDLLFQIFGNHPNVFLVRNGTIIESFKGGEIHIGKPAPVPRTPKDSRTSKDSRSPRDSRDTRTSQGQKDSVDSRERIDTSSAFMDSSEALHIPGAVKKWILTLAPSFPREHISLLIRQHDLTGKTPDHVQDLVDEWVRQLSHQPEFRVLSNGFLCLFPAETLQDPGQNPRQDSGQDPGQDSGTSTPGNTSKERGKAHLKKPGVEQSKEHSKEHSKKQIETSGATPQERTFGTCDEAVRFCYDRMSGRRRLEKRKQSLLDQIEPAIRKVESKLAHVRDPEKTLQRAERYEQMGHLLMANAHREPERGAESISVEDFYEGGGTVAIPIKPNRSLAENAESYYGKAAANRTRLEAMKHEKEELLERLVALHSLQKSLSEVETGAQLETWRKHHRESLKRALPGHVANASAEAVKPWRVTDVDGYEVWIGKNAKSNDLLTSSADKEDIWMHARGVGGSHLVIRMNRSKTLPPDGVLQHAASLAAWYSKARGSSLVPVIHTRRKYVIKQKGGAAGAVRILRESVILAEPVKPSGGLSAG